MTDVIQKLRERMSSLGISPEEGLGEEFFLFVSSLIPIVNVDLLVYNDKGQFLLSRRDDPHCGKGWHVPGGCIRFKESIDTRIHKVAEQELGLLNFTYDKTPIKVFEIISAETRDITNQNERAHFITIVFKCFAPKGFVLNNNDKKPTDVGYVRWFDRLPSDFLSIQECYKEILK